MLKNALFIEKYTKNQMRSYSVSYTIHVRLGIRLKRIATRSGKGTQPLNIETAVEQPILGGAFICYTSRYIHPF